MKNWVCGPETIYMKTCMNSPASNVDKDPYDVSVTSELSVPRPLFETLNEFLIRDHSNITSAISMFSKTLNLQPIPVSELSPLTETLLPPPKFAEAILEQKITCLTTIYETFYISKHAYI